MAQENEPANDKQPDNEYTHDSGFDADIDLEPVTSSPKAAAKAQEPDTTPAPPASPLIKKNSHPRGLARRAIGFGATQDQIDAVSTDELDEWVEQMQTQQDRELRDSVRQQIHRDQDGRGRAQSPPAKQQEQPKEPDPDDLGLGELEAELDPRLSALFKKQQAKIRELEGAHKTSAEREAARQARSTEEVYDSTFESLPAKYKKIFGDGDGRDMPTNSKELRRRIAVLSAAQLNLQSDSPTAMKRKIAAAAEELFGEILADPEPEPEAGAYGKIPAQPKPDAKANGKHFTPDEWRAGGLNKPTSREASKEPRSQKRAEKAVAEQMRARGLRDEDFDEAEESTLLQ